MYYVFYKNNIHFVLLEFNDILCALEGLAYLLQTPNILFNVSRDGMSKVILFACKTTDRMTIKMAT